MIINDKIQTFKTDSEMKSNLDNLRKNKVNVSKFIRDAINEKLQREKLIKKDKRRTFTITDLKESLNNIKL